MAYTTINKSSLHMNTKLYTGNGSTNAQTGVGFQPDLFWCKSRSNAENHTLIDAVRGVNSGLGSNTTAAAYGSTNFGSFDSDGFTWSGNLGSGNENGQTYASWNWLANGAGSANTAGSINSTVSVNTTAGFSIVKFTGTAANATVGHGLGAVPKFIFGKNIDSGSSAWPVYSSVLGGTKYLNLNTTSAEGTFSGYWNNTNPTSSVISVGSHGDVNGSGNSIIFYCFAEKTGYSKFGSYTGNGSTNGPFVYTGVRPSFVMIKRTDNTNHFAIYDNKRNGFNDENNYLRADGTYAEGNETWGDLDILSNGFKPRANDGMHNASGASYIFMAFGQSIVGSNNIPATAR